VGVITAVTARPLPTKRRSFRPRAINISGHVGRVRRDEAGRSEMSRRISIAVALPLLLLGSAQSAPANTLRELTAAIGECVKSARAGLPGSELTILFSLKRDGSLLGRPRISHAKLLGDSSTQRAFVGNVLAAFDKCLPLSITEGLGGAVAGRPMSFRVVSHPRETDT
jgi:hypothetical protein